MLVGSNYLVEPRYPKANVARAVVENNRADPLLAGKFTAHGRVLVEAGINEDARRLAGSNLLEQRGCLGRARRQRKAAFEQGYTRQAEDLGTRGKYLVGGRLLVELVGNDDGMHTFALELGGKPVAELLDPA